MNLTNDKKLTEKTLNAKLPVEFTDRMQTLLNDQMPDYLASFSAPAVKAFHLNTAKTDPTVFDAWLSKHTPDFPAKRIPDSGIYITEAEKIGHHPLHHAGLVYSQDPSAQLVLDGVALSDDLRILDLCAAPGGKTSQLARALDGGSGLLIANEPHPGRCQILLGNIERMGYRNVCVTSLQPEELANLYPEFFDLVVVDAPCSGEGMFREYPESIGEWSIENIEHCSARQREILQHAITCLRPGGRLVYSTCTYAPEEDEAQIHFLQEEYCLLPDSVPAVVHNYALETESGCFRCYPHLFDGEGQFMSYLKKSGTADTPEITSPRKSPLQPLSSKETAAFEDLYQLPATQFSLFNWRGRIIVLPFSLPRLPSHHVMCLGVTAMEWDEKKKRYLPHHQFFSAYGSILPQHMDYAPEDPELLQYIKGAELPAPAHFTKGHAAICCMGACIGGARCAGGRLKNLYPKGLREQ